MDELEKIITAITKVTGLDRFSIIYGRSDECKRARGILCYIALRDRYGLTTTLCELLGKSRSQCIFMADFCKEEMEERVSYLILMNEVRKKLGMSAILQGVVQAMRDKEIRKKLEESERKSKENSKNIFGIEYSQSEEIQLKRAILEAKEFMREYSKLGRTADGRITNCPY